LRLRDWVKMTPEERRVVRENYTRTKKIDPSQKSEQWEKYQQLPEEQKKQLAAEAASARAKKQVANLPSQAQSNVKTVAPIQRTPPALVACAAGTVKNTAASTPPCVPAPAAGTALAPASPPPGTPAVPASNAK
jgi:ATPase subunit of ABC transporter with duplicated ATPase domains